MNRLPLLALGALVLAYALGPMATQSLTPAVPFVHRDLGVSMAVAQTLISLAFATIAIATLVCGPLADRYGRRPVILTGTGLFVLGSALAALAPTPELLIFGRIVQAAGSAAGLTLARTIIHDVYGRDRSGQVLAHVTTFMMFVPMLAPVLSGTLLDHIGWRAVFGMCALFGVIALPALALKLPETQHGPKAAPGLSATLAGFGALLTDRSFLAPALFFALAMAGVFATQAAIPFLMVEILGETATAYAAWFAVGCVAYVGGNTFTGRWGHRFSRPKLILFSGIACLASTVAGLLTLQVGGLSSAGLFIPVIVFYFSVGLAIAPVQAEAVAAQPSRSGAASGLTTGLQMATGAIVVQLVGLTHDGTAAPMCAALIACSTLALVAAASFYFAPRRASVMSAAAPA